MMFNKNLKTLARIYCIISVVSLIFMIFFVWKTTADYYSGKLLSIDLSDSHNIEDLLKFLLFISICNVGITIFGGLAALFGFLGIICIIMLKIQEKEGAEKIEG